MKDFKQFREYITEEGVMDVKKLTTLIRAGLFDPNKIMVLKRALSKENAKLSKLERETLLELLERLLGLVTSDRNLYTKVRQTVAEVDESYLDEAIGIPIAGQPGNRPGTPGEKNFNTSQSIDITQIPPLIIMKRRAIRVFPDGQKVALYWADRINKFISVPFQSIGLSESTNQPLARGSLSKAAHVAAKVGGQIGSIDPDNINKSLRAAQLRRRAERVVDYAKKKKMGSGISDIIDKSADKAVQKRERPEFKSSGDDFLAASRKSNDLPTKLGYYIGGKIRKGLENRKRRNKTSVSETFHRKLEEARYAEPIDEGWATAGAALIKGAGTVARLAGRAAKGIGKSLATVSPGSSGSSAGDDEEDKFTKKYKVDREKHKAFRGREIGHLVNNPVMDKVRIRQKRAELGLQEMTKLAEKNGLELKETLYTKLNTIYKSLNEENRQAFLGMINKDKDSFNKVIDFALKN